MANGSFDVITKRVTGVEPTVQTVILFFSSAEVWQSGASGCSHPFSVRGSSVNLLYMADLNGSY